MKKTKVKKPRRLLCYIDFSDHSYYIVEYAFELAKLVDAELFVLHSVTDIKKAAGFYVPHINTDLLEDQVAKACLLYTSDAADDLLCVDLGGRRIIKKKKHPAGREWR